MPQQEAPEFYVRHYGRTVFHLFDFLDLFDMYHSWWFQLLLACLAVNLIVCSLERLSSTWKIVFSPSPSFNPERFRRLKNTEEFSDSRSPDELQKIFLPALKKSFRHVQLLDQDGSRYLFGEKYRWSRLGLYVVHLSVLLMLVGGLIGSLFGFEGFVTLPEGESIRTVRAENSAEVHDLGFELRCEDFEVSFYASGQPEEYRSDLVVFQEGKPVYEKSIRVNDPLRYQGISVYQSSYGRMPPGHFQGSAPQEISLNIRVESSGSDYPLQTRLREKNELPAGLGTLTLIDYRPDFRFKGMDLGPCLLARHQQPGRKPVHLLLPLNYPNFDKMRQGAITVLVTGTRGQEGRSPAGPVYYTGLQIKKDPGVWVVYSGFCLMIIGCFMVFSLSHQRVCLAIEREEGTSRVLVSGLANKNRLGMEKTVKRLAAKLSALS